MSPMAFDAELPKCWIEVVAARKEGKKKSHRFSWTD